MRLRHLITLIFMVLLTACSTVGDDCGCSCREELRCPDDCCTPACHRPRDCGPTAQQLSMLKDSKCDMGYRNYRLALHKKGVQIIEIGQNAIIILPTDRFFEVGCPTIREDAYETLCILACFLKTYPHVPLYISGHTDNIAAGYYNRWLSDAQAQMVQAFLWSRGFHFKALSATGCGECMPIANQLTVAGNAANRRIEIRIRRVC
jgi:outer membrane protein OmpA-like peptidoglycan-associated protein